MTRIMLIMALFFSLAIFPCATAAPHAYYANRCADLPFMVNLDTGKKGALIWNGQTIEWPVFASYLDEVSERVSRGADVLFELHDWHDNQALEKKVIAALRQHGIVPHPDCRPPRLAY